MICTRKNGKESFKSFLPVKYDYKSSESHGTGSAGGDDGTEIYGSVAHFRIIRAGRGGHGNFTGRTAVSGFFDGAFFGFFPCKCDASGRSLKKVLPSFP